nr:response regulator [Desulfobacterales bacterium]
DIRVESEAGQGSRFIFTAEFGLGAEKARKQFVPHADLRGLKTLVVDDNATSRNIFREMLESFSFEVDQAASGAEALSELENTPADQPFELVIMDWKMPQMDGIETARRIKAHPALGTRPAIIMATAYGREEIMRQAEKVGLDGFLIKPVNASVLFDTVIQAFSREAPEVGADDAPSTEGADDIGNLAGARVLLVEDNEINQQVAKEILEGGGVVVRLAANGQQGVEAVRQEVFDAVLMDIQMPVMDGYAAAREIRKDPHSQDLPIIAMTAHAMTGDAEKSRAAGMNDHVTKPIDPGQLFGALRQWIVAPKLPGETPPVPDAANEAAAVSDALPDFLNGFDLAAGLRRLQGNRQLYRKLIIDFADKCRDAAVAIRQALAAVDLEQTRHLVHSLKGAAGNLAAERVQNAAMAMEGLIKDAAALPEAERLDPALARLEESLGEIAASAGLLGRAPEAEPPPSGETIAGLAPDLRREIAGRIREAADIGDVGALKAIADELTSRSPDLQPLSRRLAGLADDFDLDGVAALADELSP